MSMDKKLELMEKGSVFVPKETVLPCFPGRSTAGPGAGTKTLAIEFDGSIVKVALTKDPKAELWLVEKEGNEAGFEMKKNGDIFIEDVHILPTLAHAPNQAFINLSNRCIYDCKFCALPTFGERDDVRIDMTPERVIRIFEIAARHPRNTGVAITSGIPDSPGDTNRRIAETVRLTRERLPETTIGVETYFEELGDVEMLRAAGADEIKINVEFWSPEIFAKLCPGRNHENILAALRQAVKLFGKGSVTSNIIVGAGETDDELLAGIEELAGIGVVANIRALRVNDINRDRLTGALGHEPETIDGQRLKRLAVAHKAILEKHGLSTLDFKTMCFSCQCCDIIPFRDL